MSITPKFIIGRPKDAPEWVKFTAIDEHNTLTYFEQKPYPDKKKPGQWRSNARYLVIDGNFQFDGAWEDTLTVIDPGMKLGDWRKVRPHDLKKPTFKSTAAAKKKMGTVARSPEMPVWVHFRAINDDGLIVYYETKPYRNSRAPGEWRGNTRSFPGGFTDVDALKGTVHRIEDEVTTPAPVAQSNPVKDVEPSPSEPTPAEPRYMFEDEKTDKKNDSGIINVGLLTSDARPEYARAAKLVEWYPPGSVIVFSYRPQWFTPDAILVPGEEAVVFKTVKGHRDKIKPIRTVRILDVRIEDGKLIIPIVVTDSDKHKQIIGVFPAPDNGKAVFTY